MESFLIMLNKELSLSDLLLLVDKIWKAFEKRISPDKIAIGNQKFLCTVGIPCLRSSLSIISSCTSEKLWINSTAEAAGNASS